MIRIRHFMLAAPTGDPLLDPQLLKKIEESINGAAPDSSKIKGIHAMPGEDITRVRIVMFVEE